MKEVENCTGIVSQEFGSTRTLHYKFNYSNPGFSKVI